MSTSLAHITVAQSDEIFQPIPTGPILELVYERHEKRRQIKSLASIISGDGLGGVVEYFLTQTQASSVPNLFDMERALKSLDADYWWKALRLTDIYDLMPQKRRTEWHKMIDERKMPEFTEETVVPTLAQLLAERPKFLAERVDGVFNALSPDHVTNSPWGFSKRMIVAGVTDQYTFTSGKQCGHINDLRAVIARLMGREEPPYGSTRFVIATLRREPGEWHKVDGGSLRMRVYKKGTCHIEIHPDMAWRLNAILAHLHPRAIPAENRRPSRKAAKDVELMQNLIPFPVLDLLASLRPIARTHDYTTGYDWSRADKHVRKEAARVIGALGGIVDGGKVRFGYPAGEVINRVIMLGAIPDEKSHQYYPTPPDLARQAVDWADIGPDHLCLEPSAGQGNLAELMPVSQTTCVEVSDVHAQVLRSKAFPFVVHGCFLDWASSTGKLFDRIVMNPPFSEGRWRAHTEAAARMLDENGIMVAILPASAKDSFNLDGLDLEWSEEHSFPGVSIKVVMMRGRRL